MRIVTLVLGGRLVLASAALAGEGTPTYTNDDLERLARRRGETGVSSVPAYASSPETGASVHDEAYWRREADKLREQLRPLRERAEALRARIDRPAPEHPAVPRASSRSGSGSRRSPSSTSETARKAAQAAADKKATLREQLRALETQIRERQDRLEERARKEGALPGWLR